LHGSRSDPGHGHPHRHYCIATQRDDDPYVDPDTWLIIRRTMGRWWPVLAAWVGERSGGRGELPPLGPLDSRFAAIEDAPGRYVFMK
jgi:poly[(R)-3-hydroxyalkanoate] polymerase subunit PhaC